MVKVSNLPRRHEFGARTSISQAHGRQTKGGLAGEGGESEMRIAGWKNLRGSTAVNKY